MSDKSDSYSELEESSEQEDLTEHPQLRAYMNSLKSVTPDKLEITLKELK